MAIAGAVAIGANGRASGIAFTMQQLSANDTIGIKLSGNETWNIPKNRARLAFFIIG